MVYTVLYIYIYIHIYIYTYIHIQMYIYNHLKVSSYIKQYRWREATQSSSLPLHKGKLLFGAWRIAFGTWRIPKAVRVANRHDSCAQIGRFGPPTRRQAPLDAKPAWVAVPIYWQETLKIRLRMNGQMAPTWVVPPSYEIIIVDGAPVAYKLCWKHAEKYKGLVRKDFVWRTRKGHRDTQAKWHPM